MARSLKWWMFISVAVTFAAVSLSAGSCRAEQLVCPSNPSAVCFAEKDADIYIGGEPKKGTMIGCSDASWGCTGGICRDITGVRMSSYTFSLDDLPKFCDLLCTPKCKQRWEYK